MVDYNVMCQCEEISNLQHLFHYHTFFDIFLHFLINLQQTALNSNFNGGDLYFVLMLYLKRGELNGAGAKPLLLQFGCSNLVKKK